MSIKDPIPPKLIRAALREVLAETDENGQSMQDAIVAKCLNKLKATGEMRDLKLLTDMLGESVIKAEISTPQITVQSQEDASMIASLITTTEGVE